MTHSSYLLFHSDHPLHVDGVNSGAENATRSLAKALAEGGQRVVVCAVLPEGEAQKDGVEYWDLGRTWDVVAALERAGEELDSFHLISSCKALPVLLGRRHHGCLSTTLMAHDPTASALGVKAKIAEELSDHMVSVSEAQKALFVKEGVNPDSIKVIHPGVDLDLFSYAPPEAHSPHRIIFAGALVPHKGVDLLIEAYAKILTHYRDATLEIYGTASLWGADEWLPYQEIERQLKGVTFHGAVSQRDLAEAMRGAGICVVSSRWFDSFPLTLLEAQASGTPVIGFDIGGVGESIDHGVTGVVVPELSADALADALHDLFQHPEKQREFSRNCLQKRESLSWRATADKYRQMIEGGVTQAPKVGFLTPWNQECGLAEYGQLMVSEFKEGTYVVFAEEGAALGADDRFVERCWKRGRSDYEKLEQAVIRHKISLLHLNCHSRFFVFPQFSSLLARLRARGVKIVATLHNTFTLDTTLKALAGGVDMLLLHSPEARLEALANGANPDTTHVLVHGVRVLSPLSLEEKRRARSHFGIPQDKKLIVTFGFIQPHKGMEGVIESVAWLKQKGIEAFGYIAGVTRDDDPGSAPYLEALRQLSRDLGVEKDILFSGRFLETTELDDLLRVADVACLNYRSQHFEASGVGSLAVGAGVPVAASLAPAFKPFGDAIWNVTSGFPPPLAVEVLLTNEAVCTELAEKSRKYARRHSWHRTALKLKRFYKQLDVEVSVRLDSDRSSPDVLVTQEVGGSTTGDAMRILFQNRSNAFTHWGGDTVVMERYRELLTARGHHVTIDVEGREDPTSFDLVHLFNFALPGLIQELGKRAHAAGVPFVVTTLAEDVASFHLQSHALSRVLERYVAEGQDARWFERNRVDIKSVAPCAPFDNRWVAQHAALLLTNGARESASLRAHYDNIGSIIEVPLGFDQPKEADPSLFINRYGVKDFIFSVGRIETRKNQLMLLKALEQIDIPLVIAGGGFSYQPEYDAAVRAFKRKGKTVILDRLDPEMLASAYAAARIHALPSWFELPGLVSLETAWLGKNIVATDRGTLFDYLGELPFYADPADERSIANAVVAAYYSPVREGIADAARQWSWDRAIDALEAAYRQAVPRPKSEALKVSGLAGFSSLRVSSPAPALAPAVVERPQAGFDDLLDRGESAAKLELFEEAHDLLTRAEALDPRSVRVCKARGAVYLAQGIVDEAQRYFDRAVAIDPSDTKSLAGAGMSRLARGEHAEAYPYFVRAVRSDSGHLLSLLKLVECSYILGRFEDLTEALQRYLARNPDDVEMKFCLAGSLFKQGNLVRAESLGRAVLEVAPEHRGALELMRLLAEEKGRVARAAGLPSFDVELADLEDEKRKRNLKRVFEGTASILNSPLASAAQKEQAELLTAECEILEGRNEPAIARYEKVLAHNPQSPRALCGKGALAANRGEWGVAEAFFRQAHDLKPSYDLPLAGLGLCAHIAKDGQRAWEWYMRALEYNPENMRSLLGVIDLGYQLGRLREVEKAILDYLELHPADIDFLYSLAGCYYAQERLADAVGEIEKITLFQPQHEKALELKAMVMDKMGQTM